MLARSAIDVPLLPELYACTKAYEMVSQMKEIQDTLKRLCSFHFHGQWVSAQGILNLARVRMDLLGKRGLYTLRRDHEILHTHRPPVLLASVRPVSLSAPI